LHILTDRERYGLITVPVICNRMAPFIFARITVHDQSEYATYSIHINRHAL
jgi:hypothetical protein